MWIDFETRSECDLKTRGVYNYALDPSTTVLCMAYAYDDGDVQLWTPGQPFPALEGRIYAHNAAFERLILWHVLGQRIPLERFYCTATQARANCMPGSLEDVGRFCGASMKKDRRGAQLVRKCCVPPFKHTEQDLADLFEYCKQDVRAMRAISKAMRPLSDEELADYHVNERINDRGVKVDLELARAAVKYAEQERKEIEELFTEITGLPSVRSPRMREWVYARVGEEGRRLMTIQTVKNPKTIESEFWKGIHGVNDPKLRKSLVLEGPNFMELDIVKEKISIDKTVRANLLAADIPDDVREVIQCADDIWSSSVAKYQRMIDLASADGRVRGAFVFAGGSATGRASSYGLQVHNLPRKVAKDVGATRADIIAGRSLAPGTLKTMLRPTLIGNFTVADWSSIEARVNPWMSTRGEDKLDVFRTRLDPYIVNAAATFRVEYEDVTPEQRQVGKVQELACGFAGGVGAFAAMGKIYGVRFTDDEARRMVDAWRMANPWAPFYWKELELAYWKAMRSPGTDVPVGRIVYHFDGEHLWYQLPSGRLLCYPFARADKGDITYAKAAWKPAQDAEEWPRGTLWPGLACIAKGTPVLTERGWVPIERVCLSDRVWDGLEWVSHDGVAHQGVGRVNYVFGVAMTADHLVLTREGWKRADQTKGCDRAPCRLPDGYETDWFGRKTVRLADFMRLRSDARHETSKLHEVSSRGAPGVVRLSQKRVFESRESNARHDASSGVRSVAVYACALLPAIALCVEKLRRAGDHCVRSLARIVREFLGRHEVNLPAGSIAGSDRQQQFVFAAELSMGDPTRTGPQHPQFSHGRQPARSDAGMRAIGTHGDWSDDTSVPNLAQRDGRGSHISAGRVSEVFDLVNCGPQRRFVVQGIDGEPLIVHNCENITQAVAHDVLRHALRQVEAVLHVHDEIVLEDGDPDVLKRVMCTPPPWAQGLPLDADVKTMTRYQK